jgi:hypothetical protein
MTGQASFANVADFISTASFIIESHIIERSRNDSRGVAQPGSAPALGAGGPRFKSARPDQIKSVLSFQGLADIHSEIFEPRYT